jgi:hypothetical protein
MPNRAAIRSRCQVRFRDTGENVYTAAEWNSYINDVAYDISADASSWTPPAPWLEQQASAVVEAQDSGVTMDTNAWRVNAVYDTTNDRPLEPIDGRSAYRWQFPAPDENLGEPQFYRFWNNVLEVYPRPLVDTTLVVDYFAPPAELAADIDIPVFPAQYHTALVYGALAFAYEDDGNPPQADLMRGRYDRIVAQMRIDMTSSRNETYPGIVDTWAED